MGRLIEVDVDKLKELLNDNKIELTNNIISIVRENYIPKADYETRLKADMVAMLEEIDLEMSEQSFGIQTEPWEVVEKLRKKIIQQKINALKAESEGKE